MRRLLIVIMLGAVVGPAYAIGEVVREAELKEMYSKYVYIAGKSAEFGGFGPLPPFRMGSAMCTTTTV